MAPRIINCNSIKCLSTTLCQASSSCQGRLPVLLRHSLVVAQQQHQYATVVWSIMFRQAIDYDQYPQQQSLLLGTAWTSLGTILCKQQQTTTTTTKAAVEWYHFCLHPGHLQGATGRVAAVFLKQEEEDRQAS